MGGSGTGGSKTAGSGTGGGRTKARVPKSTKPAPTSKGSRGSAAAPKARAPEVEPAAAAATPGSGADGAPGDGGAAPVAKAQRPPNAVSAWMTRVMGPPTVDEPVAPAPETSVKPSNRTASSGRTTPKKSSTAPATVKPSGRTTAKSGSAKSGSTKSDRAKSGSAKADDAKPGSAKSGSAKSGSAKSGSAKSGAAKGGSSKAVAVEEVEKPKGLKALLTGPPDPNYVPAKERTRPWWGMGDMVLWFVVANILGGVFVAIGASLGGYSLTWPSGTGSAVGEVVGRMDAGQAPSVTKTAADVPYLQYAIVSLIPLWIAFLGGPWLVAKRKGTSLKKDFGFTMQWRDIPFGLAIGIVSQIVLITVLYKVIFLITGEQDVSAEAERLVDRASSPLMYVLLFILTAFGSPVFEELFFRGLSQRAIAKRLGPLWGWALAAVFFALVHGQYLQFPGLLLFGLILGYLAMRFNRLGPSIWAHIGFNMVTAVILIWNQIAR